MIVVTTKVYYLKREKKPIKRNQYIWANSLIINDLDDKCPVIEG